MAEISGFGGLMSVNMLVNQYLQVEKRPLDTLETQKQDYNRKLSVYTDLRSELSGLRKRVKGFLSAGAGATLSGKQAVSSNESIVTAQASADAPEGVNSIFVARIAKRETVLSDRIAKNLKTLALRFGKYSQQFAISVGGSDAATVTVRFKNRFEKNETVLKRIAAAINKANAGVTANVLKVNNKTVRLAVVASDTGSLSEISFSGSNHNLFLNAIGLTSAQGGRVKATNFKGGYVVPDVENLDARFIINGVEITQSGNTVTDVLEGVTINLLKAQGANEQPETITVEDSGENLEKEIKNFIEDYNKALSYINEKSRIDGLAGTRGVLSGNFSIMRLRMKFREIVSQNVETGGSGGIKNIFQLGIGTGRDGILKINDEETFTNRIKDYADEVRYLFTAEDGGLAARLEKVLSDFTQTGGILSDSEKGIKTKIRNIDRRTRTLNNRLNGRELSLRRKFANLQKVLNSLNTQQLFLQRFTFPVPGGALGYYGRQQFLMY